VVVFSHNPEELDFELRQLGLPPFIADWAPRPYHAFREKTRSRRPKTVAQVLAKSSIEVSAPIMEHSIDVNDHSGVLDALRDASQLVSLWNSLSKWGPLELQAALHVSKTLPFAKMINRASVEGCQESLRVVEQIDDMVVIAWTKCVSRFLDVAYVIDGDSAVAIAMFMSLSAPYALNDSGIIMWGALNDMCSSAFNTSVTQSGSIASALFGKTLENADATSIQIGEAAESTKAAAHQATETLKTMDDAIHRITPALEGAAVGLQDVTSKISEAIASMNLGGKTISDLPAFVYRKIKELGPVVGPLIVAVLAVWHVLSPSESIRVALITAGSAVALFYTAPAISEFVVKLLDPQSSTQGPTGLLDSIACLVMAMFQLQGTQASVRSLVYVLKDLPRATDGVRSLVSAATALAAWILDYIPCMRGYFCSNMEYETFARRANSLINKHNEKTLGINSQTLCEIQKCIEAADDIIMRATAKQQPALAVTVRNTNIELRKLNSLVSSHVRNGTNVFIEPVGVFFFGNPGTGKTSLTEAVLNAYFRSTLNEAEMELFLLNPNQYIFHRGITKDAYWEGSNFNTRAIVINDFGQEREVVGGGKSDAIDFIALINGKPTLVPMAFDEKGHNWLHAEVVIADSNLMSLKSDVIVDQGALARRVHLCYKVDINPDFVPNGDEMDPNRWYIRRAVINEQGHETSEVVTPAQIVKDMIERRKKHARTAFSKSAVKIEATDPSEFNAFLKSLAEQHAQPTESEKALLDHAKAVTGLEWNLNALKRTLTSLGVLPFWEYSLDVCKLALKRVNESFFVLRDTACMIPQLGDIDLTSIFDPLWVGLKQLVGFCKDNVVSLAIASAVVSLLVPTLAVTRPQGDDSASYGQRVVASKGRAPSIRNKVQTRTTTFQGGAYEFNKNLFMVTCTLGTGVFGQALGIRDDYVLMPMHFIRDAFFQAERAGVPTDGASFVFTGQNRVFKVCLSELTSNNMSLWAENHDLVVLKVSSGRGFDMFANILPHIASHQTIAKIVWGSREMQTRLTCPPHGEHRLRDYMGSTYMLLEHAARTCEGLITVKNVARYKARTVSGDCGALLRATGTVEEPVIGMHFAGDNFGYGYATLFSREILEKLIEGVGVDHDPDEFMESFDKLYHTALPATNTNLATRIVSTQGLQPGTTALLANFPRISPNAPADLSEAAYEAALKKVGLVDISQCSMVIVNAACASYFSDCLAPLVPRRVYTLAEALRGIEGDPTFRALDRSSALGYPYTHPKRDAFDENFLPVGGLGRRVLDDIGTTLSIVRGGQRPITLYTDFLKDERRPIQKVKDKATRLISACPMAYLAAFRMYFGAFMHSFSKAKGSNGTAIGVNVYNDDWNDVALRMISVAGGKDKLNYGAGDYKAFDFTEHPDVHRIILKHIQDWYGDPPDSEPRVVREILWLDVVNSYHIRADRVREWRSGLPSGHPMTTIINCIYNHIAFRYAWVRLHDGDLTSLPHFRDNVCLFVLGDDNVFSVSDAYVHEFTPVNIGAYMAEMGLVYTSDTKDVTLGGMRLLRDVTFLKRRFIYDPHTVRFLAPQDLDSLLETVLWTKKKDAVEIFKSNCRHTLRELSLHSPDVFDYWSSAIINCCTLDCNDFGDGRDQSTLRAIVRGWSTDQ